MDAGRLRAFSDYVGGSGCVVRHGCLAHTWGDWRARAEVASAAKPLYSHFLFKAVEDGRLRSLDDLVITHEPRLAGINSALGYKDRKIAWRHLANQTACYGVAERPGEAFVYNDWQMALFFDTLFLKVYGSDYAHIDDRVLRPMLTEPLGCEDSPTFMAFGAEDRPGRLAISPRDFARFGLLYLRRGNWNGGQLLSSRFARAAVSTPLANRLPQSSGKEAEMMKGQRSIGSRQVPDNQTDHLGSYSWLWWVNGVDRAGKRNWPDAPLDTFAALGHGGQDAMVVIPSLDLVASWNHSTIADQPSQNRALKLLVDSRLARQECRAYHSSEPQRVDGALL